MRRLVEWFTFKLQVAKQPALLKS